MIRQLLCRRAVDSAAEEEAHFYCPLAGLLIHQLHSAIVMLRASTFARCMGSQDTGSVPPPRLSFFVVCCRNSWAETRAGNGQKKLFIVCTYGTLYSHLNGPTPKSKEKFIAAAHDGSILFPFFFGQMSISNLRTVALNGNLFFKKDKVTTFNCEMFHCFPHASFDKLI